MSKPTFTLSLRSPRIGLIGLGIASSLFLAGCGTGDLIDSITPRLGGATYAGDIQPTVARVPDRQEASSGLTATQGFDTPQPADGTGEGAGSAQAADGTPTPTAQAPAPTDPVDATPEPVTETAPAGVPSAQDAPSSTVAAVASPSSVEPPSESERPDEFPNLADVPETPDDLPTQDEIDAEREALQSGEPAPAPADPPVEEAPLEDSQPATTTGQNGGGSSGSSLLGSLRERLEDQQTQGPSTVYFEEGSTTLSDSGTIASVAERWRGTEAEIRVVGYARILGDGQRAEALGTALQRANAVAAALVEAGVTAGDVSVFANALEGEPDERRTRRVDIFIE